MQEALCLHTFPVLNRHLLNIHIRCPYVFICMLTLWAAHAHAAVNTWSQRTQMDWVGILFLFLNPGVFEHIPHLKASGRWNNKLSVWLPWDHSLAVCYDEQSTSTSGQETAYPDLGKMWEACLGREFFLLIHSLLCPIASLFPSVSSY